MSDGWKVVWVAFAVAVFGWGIGFYGPSVYLPTLHATRGLVDLDDLHRGDGALSPERLPDCLVARGLPAVRRPWDHLCRRALGRAGRRHLGQRAAALATCAGSVGERYGMGGDQRGGTQCHRRTMVRSRPAEGDQYGVQWRKRRRRRIRAALGGADLGPWSAACGPSAGRRDDCDPLSAGALPSRKAATCPGSRLRADVAARRAAASACLHHPLSGLHARPVRTTRSLRPFDRPADARIRPGPRGSGDQRGHALRYLRSNLAGLVAGRPRPAPGDGNQSRDAGRGQPVAGLRNRRRAVGAGVRAVWPGRRQHHVIAPLDRPARVQGSRRGNGRGAGDGHQPGRLCLRAGDLRVAADSAGSYIAAFALAAVVVQVTGPARSSRCPGRTVRR